MDDVSRSCDLVKERKCQKLHLPLIEGRKAREGRVVLFSDVYDQILY